MRAVRNRSELLTEVCGWTEALRDVILVMPSGGIG